MPKKIKVKVTVVRGGIDTEIEQEVEVPDDFTDEMARWPEQKTSKGQLLSNSARYLGHRVSRVDGADKVTGKMKYAYDITAKQAPGLLVGRMIPAMRPHARIRAIDTSAAEKIPGVVAIELLVDVAANRGTEIFRVGTPIGAVAAETEEAADDAVHAVKIQYQDLEFVVNLDQALRDDAPVGLPDQVSRPNIAQTGSVDQGFSQAEATVQQTYEVATRVHACLETHGNTVWYKGDSAVVWSSTQNVYGVQNEFAGILGLPRNQVEVITEAMGGGFGSKFSAGVEGRLAGLLSKKTRRPVRLMMTRQEEFWNAGNQPGGRAQVKIGGTKDGKITAFQIKVWGAAGENGGQVGGPDVLPYIYAIPNKRFEGYNVKLNSCPFNAFRAPRHPQSCFITESAVDELAYKLGVDPVEFRIKNDASRTRQEQWRIGATEIGWATKFNKNPSAAGGPRKRGVGCGGHTWGGGGNRNTTATVKVFPDGHVEILSGSQDLGTGNRTLFQMIAAEELGCDLQDVQAMIGHSTYGPAGGSGGSTTAPSIAPAAKAAAGFARVKMAKVLAQALGVDEKRLVFANGAVMVQGDASRTLPFKQACAKLKEPIVAEGQWYGLPTLSSVGVGGVQFAEVEVDLETGKVRVVRVVAVQDSGYILNHKTWESQCVGGVIIGVGFGLLENRLLDGPTGFPLNPNFDDYKLPMAHDIPEIKVIPYHQPERGVIGVGEPPTISTAAAIANAVYNACGARIRSLPISPEKVLKALSEQRAELERGIA